MAFAPQSNVRQRNSVRFAKEINHAAVRLPERGEKPATHLARDLGVARNQLYNWQTQLNCGLDPSEIATHTDIHYTIVSKVVNE